MAASAEEFRCFVGGLSWDTTDKILEDAFRSFGNVSEAKVVVDRDTGRSRGFGFVTFGDERSMDDAIDRMHGKDLDGRSITVNKAQPKTGGSGGGDRGYGGGGGGGGYNGGGKSYSGGGGGGGGSGDCFKCGQPGHWARECPSSGGAGGGGGGGRYSSDRYGSSRGDRYGSSGGGSYGGGSRYGSGGDRSERSSDRYNGGDRYGGGAGGRSSSGREGGGRGGGSSDRYSGGGPSRYEGGSHRDRSGPYDRPSATSGGSRSSYEDRY